MRALRGRHHAGIALVASVVLISLTGCSLSAAPHDDLDRLTAASSSGAPAPESVDDLDLSAEVYRTRSDPARGGAQLVVHNNGATTLTIVSAHLQSPALAEPWLREKRTVIAPGQTRDLALLLGDPACPADTDPPLGVLQIVLANGSRASVTLPTTDRLGQWAAWVDEQCFAAAVRDRVQLTFMAEPALDGEGVIGAVLQLDGRDDALDVTVTGVRGTVLLSLLATAGDAERDASVAPGDVMTQRMLDASVDEGRSVSIPIVMAPTRCDPHALADDKQGTLLPVEVTLGSSAGSSHAERRGVVIVAADATTKAQLYEAIVRACAL